MNSVRNQNSDFAEYIERLIDEAKHQAASIRACGNKARVLATDIGASDQAAKGYADEVDQIGKQIIDQVDRLTAFLDTRKLPLE